MPPDQLLLGRLEGRHVAESKRLAEDVLLAGQRRRRRIVRRSRAARAVQAARPVRGRPRSGSQLGTPSGEAPSSSCSSPPPMAWAFPLMPTAACHQQLLDLVRVSRRVLLEDQCRRARDHRGRLGGAAAAEVAAPEPALRDGSGRGTSPGPAGPGCACRARPGRRSRVAPRFGHGEKAGTMSSSGVSVPIGVGRADRDHVAGRTPGRRAPGRCSCGSGSRSCRRRRRRRCLPSRPARPRRRAGRPW